MKKETSILLNTRMNKTEIKNKIGDLFIVRENDGSYNLFGRYIIQNNNGEFILNERGENQQYRFYFLKHAVAWCVLNNAKNHKSVRRIHELDNDLVSLDAAIENYVRLLRKNKENSLIYVAKLKEEKLKKRRVLDEINGYTLLSKHIQRTKYKQNQDL